jgi:ABC-2 type transport system permease protein
VINVLRVVVTSFQVQIKDRITSSTLQFTLFVQPVLFMILSVGLYRFAGKADLGLYAVIGSGMIGIWNANLWTSGFIIEGERWGGTLEHILASPTPLEIVLVGKSLSNSAVSLLAMFLTFATGALVYRVPLGIPHPLAFITGLALTVVAMTCLGLLLGTLFVLTRSAGNMTQVLNYPIFILSGLTFPITILPLWTRPISAVLAPTWGTHVLETAAGLSSPAILDRLPEAYWVNYLILVFLAVVYYFIAHQLYRLVERIARRLGGLQSY